MSSILLLEVAETEAPVSLRVVTDGVNIISLKCIIKILSYITGVDDISVTNIVWRDMFVRTELSLILHDIVVGCIASTMRVDKGGDVRSQVDKDFTKFKVVELFIGF